MLLTLFTTFTYVITCPGVYAFKLYLCPKISWKYIWCCYLFLYVMARYKNKLHTKINYCHIKNVKTTRNGHLSHWTGTAVGIYDFTPGPSCVRRNMAASMLCRRTAALCRTLKDFSSCKAVLSVNSPCGSLSQTASYNPKPLKLNLRNPYIPDKDSEKTPEWQKTARYDKKLFGRYGSVSGIDPASLWPTHEELEKIIAEETQWHPPIEVMLKNIEAREKEESEKRLAR